MGDASRPNAVAVDVGRVTDAALMGRAQIACVAVTVVLSALSHDAGQMTASCVLTGPDIGAVFAISTPSVAEFANARRRAFAVTVVAIGYLVDGVLDGLVAAALLRAYG